MNWIASRISYFPTFIDTLLDVCFIANVQFDVLYLAGYLPYTFIHHIQLLRIEINDSEKHQFQVYYTNDSNRVKKQLMMH